MQKDDVIDRQAAISECFNVWKVCDDTREIDEFAKLMVDALQKLPSAQLERKKGHWIFIGDGCTCSNCYWTHEDSNGFTLLTQYSFCPSCGADMREGETDD